jgi:hypothetical protein
MRARWRRSSPVTFTRCTTSAPKPAAPVGAR